MNNPSSELSTLIAAYVEGRASGEQVEALSRRLKQAG